MTTCTLHLLTCGYCTSDQRIALKGAPGKTIQFPALTALIRHPQHGNIVFDTGYASRVLTETKRWPGFLLGLATPIYFREEENLIQQLSHMGVTPEQVPYLIVSHFHADHTGGLLDFPESKIICHRDALGLAVRKTGLAALNHGMLPRLFPSDMEKRAWVMEPGCKEEVQVPVFERAYDLFGDGSIRLVELPGHAAGQMGALVETPQGPVLLAADAAWHCDNFRKMQTPSPIVKMIIHSWPELVASLEKLHTFYTEHPDTPIIPTHCGDSIAHYLSQQEKQADV